MCAIVNLEYNSRDISQERYIAQSLFARIKCFLAKNANRQQIPPKTIIQYDGCVTQLNKDLTKVKSHSESRVTERLLRPGKKCGLRPVQGKPTEMI